MICRNLTRIKKEKILAIENAQCISRWTKKIIIERNLLNNGDFLNPVVRVEKTLLQNIEGIEHYSSEFESDEDWEFPREFLSFGDELGQGAFGKVVHALAYSCEIKTRIIQDPVPYLVATHNDVPPIEVAVKMIKECCNDEDLIDFVKEIEIMKAIGGHVNIVNLLGVCTQPLGMPICAIMEYAEHGNLRDYLRSKRELLSSQSDEIVAGNTVTLRDMLRIAWQVSRGMQFLASKKCVHRDLAARNVLIAKDLVVKVADFGLAR